MPEDIYRKLAQRLDTIPNGFPATESGVELRLLAKIFAPEEAALAVVMRLTREPATDIAARANVDPDAAYRMLKGMARKGLIRAKRGEDQLIFGLMPFVVGIYEEQLPRMDTELATLFEQYYQETQGGIIIRDMPAVHRVVPVEEAIPFDLEIFPYERATELLEGAKSWGVRDCICRVQQRLVGKGCDHPVENCLVFAPVEGAFDHSKVDRAITKEEALHILHEAEEAGLVHCPGNYRDGVHYICNCGTCCCGILRGVAEFGIPTAVARSNFYALVDAEACIGCGECVERCQFEALAVPEDICVVDYARCVGCGLCATVCTTGALRLERRPEGEGSPPPADIKEWMIQRAQERGISIFDVL
ncbi:MAG: 4Fe-4S binding protein [Chloroflexota bacterium]|nr:4Fe-4S binding protein [Chloroflexota bacterium]